MNKSKTAREICEELGLDYYEVYNEDGANVTAAFLDAVHSEIVAQKSSMQKHLEKHTVGEVCDYITKTLTDDRLNDYGGPMPFLEAVEIAEKQGPHREQVLDFVENRKEEVKASQ